MNANPSGTSPAPAVPVWLWRGVAWGFVLLVTAVAGLASALAVGLADPPRAGPLLWETDFKTSTAGWTWRPPPGGQLAPEAGVLVAQFGRPTASSTSDLFAVGLTAGPAGDFTLEVAGAAADMSGAAYGLVFGWRDDKHYQAVLVNGNGYAEAYQQAGHVRTEWFTWQQWPHILPGTSANRVRVDVRGRTATLRVNDEVLVADVAVEPHGYVGLIARAPGQARVLFSWARLWAIK